MSARRSIPGRGAGRGAEGPGGPAGNAGARGALLLAVAVILGIVLLQQFDSDTGGGAVAANSIPGGEATTTTRPPGLTSLPQVTSTTARPRAKADVTILVANGAGVRGLGAATSTALQNFGYTTLSPTDANASVPKTSIQFAEGYEAEAREVANALTQPATVVTRLASPPVAAAEIGDAKVIVILGVDVANSASTTTVAGAITSTTRRP